MLWKSQQFRNNYFEWAIQFSAFGASGVKFAVNTILWQYNEPQSPQVLVDIYSTFRKSFELVRIARHRLCQPFLLLLFMSSIPYYLFIHLCFGYIWLTFHFYCYLICFTLLFCSTLTFIMVFFSFQSNANQVGVNWMDDNFNFPKK